MGAEEAPHHPDTGDRQDAAGPGVNAAGGAVPGRVRTDRKTTSLGLDGRARVGPKPSRGPGRFLLHVQCSVRRRSRGDQPGRTGTRAGRARSSPTRARTAAPARSGRPVASNDCIRILKLRKEPIRFREREPGPEGTKPVAGSILELLRDVWRPRPASRRVLVRYGLTGLAGALINLGTFQILLELGLHKFLASPIAIELSIVANFLMHNYWTFADRDMIGGRRVRGLKYNLASLVTLALNYAAFVGLSILFPQAPPVLLQGCCIAPIALLNYSVSSRWTFRGTPSKAPAGSGSGRSA